MSKIVYIAFCVSLLNTNPKCYNFTSISKLLSELTIFIKYYSQEVTGLCLSRIYELRCFTDLLSSSISSRYSRYVNRLTTTELLQYAQFTTIFYRASWLKLLTFSNLGRNAVCHKSAISQFISVPSDKFRVSYLN